MALGSIFSGLFKKKSDTSAAAAQASAPSSQPAPSEGGESRIRRRLAVDQAVSVALSAAGVSASGYKHEAKRMDPNGQRFLVTIDLNSELADVSAGKLSQVGAAIIQYAKSKGETELTAVYWRVEPGSVPAGPVSLVAQRPGRQAAASVEAKSAVPAAPAAAAPAQDAPSEKIAKLRAMMKNDGPSAPRDGASAAFQKTQVMKAFDEGDAGKHEKTQVMRAVDSADAGKYEKTQVMRAVKSADPGKSGKA